MKLGPPTPQEVPAPAAIELPFETFSVF